MVIFFIRILLTYEQKRCIINIEYMCIFDLFLKGVPQTGRKYTPVLPVQNMYFGSVKFFRHLILTVVFGWIGVATVLAVYFGVKCHTLDNKSEPRSIEEYVEQMTADGYSLEEIAAYIDSSRTGENDPGIPAIATNAENGETGDSDAEGTLPTETIKPPGDFILPSSIPDYYEPAVIGQNGETAAASRTDDTETAQSGDDNDVIELEAPPRTEETSSVTEETAAAAQADVTGTEAPVYPATVPEREELPVYTTTAPPMTDAPVRTEESISVPISERFTDMYVKNADKKYTPSAKTVFLTFEGEPSENMWDILTILERQRAKGTFFLSSCGTGDDRNIVKYASDCGHTPGILAGSKSSYSGAAEYIEEFAEIYADITAICGSAPRLYRIPDSVKMTTEVRQQVNAELERRGFIYCDYNAVSGDTSPDADWQGVYDTVISNVFMNRLSDKASTVLLHCGSDLAVLTTEDIITGLYEQGYAFAALSGGTEIK